MTAALAMERPGSAATLAEPTIQKSPERKLNVHMNSTATPPEASADPLAPRGMMTCTIDMAALRQMTMRQLFDLRGVLHTLGDLAATFSSTSRFGDTEAYNEAGRVLYNLTAFINGYEQAVVNVAQAAKPTSRGEAEWQGWTIVGFEADMADDLADFSVIAAQAARDERAAK